MKKRDDFTYNAPKAIPKLDKLLHNFISDIPHLRKLSDLMRISDAWKAAVGEQIAGFTSITGFRDGILSVRVSHSVWRSEFYHIEEEIKRKLRARLKDIEIKKIRFM